jgi:Mg-chelatase subunit ChlD
MEMGKTRRLDSGDSLRRIVKGTGWKSKLRNEVQSMKTAASATGSSSVIHVRDPMRFQNKGLDSIFVLDCSRSMGEKLDANSKSTKLDICKTALVSALSRASESNCPDRVGLLAVYTNVLAKPIVNEVMKFGEISKKELGSRSIPIEEIVALKCQGGTALYAAISNATKILVANKSAKSASQQIIMITDSKNNTGEEPMKVLSESAKNRIKIHVVDLGNKKVVDSLKMICDATGGQFAFVTNAGDLHSNLYAAFSAPVENREREDSGRARVFFPNFLGEQARPPVTPKRRKAETVEEIRSSIDQIKGELESMAQLLRSGQMNQMQYTEKYSILQFDLQELRQSIREQRSRLNRELSEYALAQDKVPDDSLLNREMNERLLELDRQIEILKQSAAFVS